MRKPAFACLLLSLALPAQEDPAVLVSTLLITEAGKLTDAPRSQLKGRQAHWPLGGEDGLTGVFEILRDELEITMVLAGRPTIASIDSTLIRKMPSLD